MQTEVSISNRARRSPRDYAGLVLRGMAMGASDIVPGVSGATMALILGIYEELIQSIREVAHPPVIRALLGVQLKRVLAIVNWPFLVSVAAGIGISFLTLSHLLEWLLLNQPVQLWSFFFGLVVASVYTVGRRIARWTPGLAAALVLAAVGAYVVVGLVPARTPETYFYLFVSGMLAICAMILPGISGAFILVLLGKYQYVLGALNDRDIVTLAVVAAGAGVGIVTFAQIIGWLFKRYHDLTVAMLTGLMLGSLRKIWPWKEVVEFLRDAQGALLLDSHGEQIVALERNVLPSLSQQGLEIGLAVVLMVVGLSAVMLLSRIADQDKAA